MSSAFHVTSVQNRRSIQCHGLDVKHMGVGPGIAGSTRPEAEAIFLATEDWDVDLFVRMNKTGGPVDVWQVDGVDADELVDNGHGLFYVPGRIPVDRITLVQRDLPGGNLSLDGLNPHVRLSTVAGRRR